MRRVPTLTLVRHGLTAALAAVAVAALCSGVPAVAQARPAPPACDQIKGVTEIQSDRWRVFHPILLKSSRGSIVSTYACRRRLGPARTIVRVAWSQDDVTSCECSYAHQLVGDLLLMHNLWVPRTAVASFGPQVVDLAHARYAHGLPLDADFVANAGSPWAFLTPSLGLVAGVDEPIAGNPDALSPGKHWVVDAAGTVATVAPLRDAARAIGSGTDPAGAYATAADGTVVRIAAIGAAHLRWIHDDALKPVPNTMSGDRHRRTVAAGTLPGYSSVAIDAVEQRYPGVPAKYAGPRPTWLELRYPTGKGIRIANFSPASMTTLKVLASSARGVLVLGTRDHARGTEEPPVTAGLYVVRYPNESTALRRPVIELDPSTIPSGRGLVAITAAAALAIADGDTLRIWDPAPRTLDVPGVHDLSANGAALYYTDGAGQPHRIELGRADG